MTLYQLNKTANLVTVATETKLSALKQKLSKDGLYFGYHPLHESDDTLAAYISERTPNLYHFKFGSLSDLVSTMTVELKSGGPFRLKDAPRSAIGPDFNRCILGSQGRLARVQDVTLRLVALPERIRCSVIKLTTREAAQKFVVTLIGQFIKPLFFRHYDFESVPKFAQTRSGKEKTGSDILIFCLGGLDDIVKIEESVVENLCQTLKYDLRWLDIQESQELMNRHIFKNESYAEIQKQYSDFIWTPSDAAQHTMLEKKFAEFLTT